MLLLLRSKYVCVYFWMTVEVSICIVWLMFMYVYHWQVRHIPCTGTRCNTVFIPIPVCITVTQYLQSCVQCFHYRERADGHDIFVYRQDRRWWLAHLWKEDRKCVIEEKTSACRHLNSAEGSNSTKTKDQYKDGPIFQSKGFHKGLQRRTQIQFTHPEACDWCKIHASSTVLAI